MQKSSRAVVVLGLLIYLSVYANCFGQSSAVAASSSGRAAGTGTSIGVAPRANASGRFGMGVKVSLLGGGVEAAARVTHRTNIRGGFNMLTYNNITFQQDNVSYAGKLDFKTIEGHFDIFPRAGSFHVGPALVVFLGDPVSATATVAGGTAFNLSGQTYYSDASNPVGGSAKFNFNKAAPGVTLGWGNLVSRNERKRFTVPFELGVVFQGAPKSALSLTGDVCDSPGVNCRAIASDPIVQSKVVAEEASLNNKASSYKYYPIFSLGFGLKF